jgi:hypothetical protein
MTSFLKTLLHVLSIVVICTAMAACSPVQEGGKYTSYESLNVSAQNQSIMDY